IFLLDLKAMQFLRIKDIAKVYPRFEDHQGFARINGLPSVMLEISKRNGKNIIDTVNQVKILNG
ncbi:efflux RND transporter permease subunit, partial [Wolbachia endosymbiont of Glossina morsitans morsitans]|uniref:efflux RND transporter permease subunit n=1 Tax=Wolbachia endosymbiont of Glossina morsitans morsitans TaxID=1150948 RepID=UPI0023A99E03